MTTATVNRNGETKRVQMTMLEKSFLLEVIDIHETGLLAVRSNSNPEEAYAVYYDENFHVTKCRCKGCREYGRATCAYRIAAQRRLNEMRRNWHVEIFGLYA